MSFDNRPDHPMKSEMFVKLVTENELRKDTIKKFYTTVKNSIPEGILGAYEVKDPKGNPTQSYLVHRVTEEGQHEYEIPLIRNLTKEEIYEATMNLDRSFNEGNFLLETSTFDDECCLNEDEDDLYIEADVYERVAEKLAERMHNKWMHDRIEAGWRYGQQRCNESKTHPLIKPWNQLSEDQRHVDYDMPEFFIDLLAEYGYSIVSQEELNEMLDLIDKKVK